MKLMIESVDYDSLEIIKEDSGSGSKSWKIRGPFMQAETKNRNGRIYPKKILDREVNRYMKERINTKRALGELDHPPTPQINLDRVSHLIEDLTMSGNDAIGTAKLLDTPMGRIAQSLLDGGVKLGVSSRGVGSMKESIVNEDYNLICIDIVGDPSALNAYVDGIYENAEYIVSGNTIVETAVKNLKQELDAHGTKRVFEDMKRFLHDIEKFR